MRRHDDRRGDDYNRDYRGREGRDYKEDREDRVRRRSRSRSASRSRRRSRSPPVGDRRTTSSYRTSTTSYRDLDRPEQGRQEPKEIRNEKITENMKKDTKPVVIQEKPVEQEFIGDEDAQLAAFLGITGFASTKGQKVKGNEHNEAVDTVKKRREYRQYLFVKGAYDIPLTQEQLEAKEKKHQNDE